MNFLCRKNVIRALIRIRNADFFWIALFYVFEWLSCDRIKLIYGGVFEFFPSDPLIILSLLSDDLVNRAVLPFGRFTRLFFVFFLD